MTIDAIYFNSIAIPILSFFQNICQVYLHLMSETATPPLQKTEAPKTHIMNYYVTANSPFKQYSSIGQTCAEGRENHLVVRLQ
jgi:hypothetical protein